MIIEIDIDPYNFRPEDVNSATQWWMLYLNQFGNDETPDVVKIWFPDHGFYSTSPDAEEHGFKNPHPKLGIPAWIQDIGDGLVEEVYRLDESSPAWKYSWPRNAGEPSYLTSTHFEFVSL